MNLRGFNPSIFEVKKVMEKNGFSLIEVLVTMAIISVGLLGTATLTMRVMHSNKSSASVTMATTLAQDRLEQIRNLDDAPGIGDQEDSGYNSITAYPAYRRVVSAAAVGSPPQANMRAVTVTVFWDNDERSISLSTIIRN